MRMKREKMTTQTQTQTHFLFLSLSIPLFLGTAYAQQGQQYEPTEEEAVQIVEDAGDNLIAIDRFMMNCGQESLDTADPEASDDIFLECLAVLDDYNAAMEVIWERHGTTIDRYAYDSSPDPRGEDEGGSGSTQNVPYQDQGGFN